MITVRQKATERVLGGEDGAELQLSLGTASSTERCAPARGHLPGNVFCFLLLHVCFTSFTLEALRFNNCYSAANSFGKWASHGVRLCARQGFLWLRAGAGLP